MRSTWVMLEICRPWAPSQPTRRRETSRPSTLGTRVITGARTERNTTTRRTTMSSIENIWMLPIALLELA
jgi:hypothetical protein